jgi:hypothetical protein
VVRAGARQARERRRAGGRRARPNRHAPGPPAAAEHVDLIDLDIQGAELDAGAAGAWSAVASVPLGARRSTPLGEASFDGGGIQLWLNGAAR